MHRHPPLNLGYNYIELIKDMIKWSEKGFTLIELMMVVVILGILATLALGAFRSYQAKSKQAEAKINLGAIGDMAEAYRAEHDTYVASFANLGWQPNFTTRYRYWYNGASAVNTPTSPEAGVDYTDQGSAASQNSFTAAAVGNIDSDLTADQWTFNDLRDLSNIQNDATTP